MPYLIMPWDSNIPPVCIAPKWMQTHLSSSVLLETVTAQMASVAHLGSLEKLSSRGLFFCQQWFFSSMSLWSLVPAGVWNRSCVLMFHSTGWGFPAQTDAGNLGSLAKEPTCICQPSCFLVVYSCGGLALMAWMPPTRPLFTCFDLDGSVRI